MEAENVAGICSDFLIHLIIYFTGMVQNEPRQFRNERQNIINIKDK